MTGKAGKLMASSTAKHCHGPELHPVISGGPDVKRVRAFPADIDRLLRGSPHLQHAKMGGGRRK